MRLREQIAEFLRRLRLLPAGREGFHQDLEEEMRLHRDLRAEELQEAGLPPEEAALAAQRRFGNTLRLREQSRELWGWNWLDHLAFDIRYSIRRLRRTPGFTAVAVLTLALGIGANSAIFTLVHAILLRSLPVSHPEELYSLGDDHSMGSGGGFFDDVSLYSYDEYKYLRDHLPEFSSLAGFQSTDESLSVRREGKRKPAEQFYGKFVSGNYFSVFGVSAIAGRTILPEDDQPGSHSVAVMSYRAWHDHYNSDPKVIGANFSIKGVPTTVVGVTPPGFFGETLESEPPDFWLPLSSEPQMNGSNALLNRWNEFWLYAIGRVKPGVLPAQLQAHATAEVQHWLAVNYAPDKLKADGYHSDRYSKYVSRQHIIVQPAARGVSWTRDYSAAGLRLLMIMSALLLLIACGNLANLLLARGIAARVQTAVRIALGASRARVLRQMVIEGLLLALVGGALGLWLAEGGSRAMLLVGFRGDYVPIDPTPSFAVLGFTFGLALFTGILFSVAPAWISSALSPADPMRTAARSAGDRSSVAQRSLIIFQAALSLVLLCSAGLLTRTLLNLEDQRFGVSTEGRLIVHVDSPVSLYRPDQLQPFYQQLQAKLERIPGVATASFSDSSPMSGSVDGEPVSIEGRPGWRPDLGDVKWPNEDRISAHYFETIGTRVLRGRPIGEQDTPTSQHVAVIDRTFARLYFPGQDPIGRHFGIQEESHAGDYEIVGIVEDAEYSNPKQPNVPTFFLPLLQQEKYSDSAEDLEQASSKYIRDIELHVQGNPEAYKDRVRRALDELNPNLGVISTRSLQQQISRNFSYSRMLAWLMAGYGILALLLAAVGLYGVASYSVARRTNEIGIRMALGADRGNVMRLVLRTAISPIFLGLAIGIPLSLATARALASQLYGVKSYDPAIFLAAIAVLGLAAVVASFVPARRAASIDPMQALRME